MGLFYRRKLNSTDRLSNAESEDEIERLEEEREGIDTEIERLLSDYARLTRDRTVKKGARRIGTSPKDISYWDLPEKSSEK